ncbi:hypothetical protein [Niabella aquatica]
MSNTRKHPKDPFETRCWLYQPVTDPYQVIAGFFAEAHVHDFRKLIKKLVSSASGAGVYKGESPGDVLLYMKMIRSFIKAAHALRHKKHSPVIINGDDLFNKKYYCSHYVSANAWKEFPRQLSEKEYGNPYLVFQKFFRYQSLTNWLHCWEQVVDGAFCGDGSFAPVAPFKVHSHLAKLVEAAHLIDVREEEFEEVHVSP